MASQRPNPFTDYRLVNSPDSLPPPGLWGGEKRKILNSSPRTPCDGLTLVTMAWPWPTGKQGRYLEANGSDPGTSFSRGLLPGGVMAKLGGEYLLPTPATAKRFLVLKLVCREH